MRWKSGRARKPQADVGRVGAVSTRHDRCDAEAVSSQPIRSARRASAATSALLVVGLLVPFVAHAQPAAAGHEPVVLVVDGSAHHVSVSELVRSLEVALDRPVVRPTDPVALTTRAMISVAFAPPRRWLVRVETAGAHTSRSVELRASDVPALSRLASEVVLELEATNGHVARTPASPEVVARTPASSEVAYPNDPWDPFAWPIVPRLTIAFVGALVDPFSTVGGPVRVLGTPDVVDPWR